MWANYEHKCHNCDGYGEIVCSECDSEHECVECSGTGIDPEKVNLEAFNEATKKAFAGCTSSWEIIENDVWIGRQGENGAKVYYRDFLRSKG